MKSMFQISLLIAAMLTASSVAIAARNGGVDTDKQKREDEKRKRKPGQGQGNGNGGGQNRPDRPDRPGMGQKPGNGGGGNGMGQKPGRGDRPGQGQGGNKPDFGGGDNKKPDIGRGNGNGNGGGNNGGNNGGNKPDFDRDNNGRGNGNGGGNFGRNRDEVERKRNQVRDDRKRNDYERRQNQQRRHNERNHWRHGHNNHWKYDRHTIRSHTHWTIRFNVWTGYCPRPRPVYYARPIRWYQPMPTIGYWEYNHVEIVAQNMEYMSREIYETLDRVAPYNTEYGMRLRRVLFQLVDAAENLSDSVDNTYYFNDSLYDLFHLESSLQLTEQTLDGYSQSYRVDEEMRAMRYYVNELLWTYHNGYGRY